MTRPKTRTSKWILPSKSWSAYLNALQFLVEGSYSGPAERLEFLISLGLVSNIEEPTKEGRKLYDAVFIHNDDDAAQQVLAEALLRYPPAMAILQLLGGARGVNRENVVAVLRSRGFFHSQSDGCIGSLLMLLNRAKLVRYNKANRSIQVIWRPLDEPTTPKCMFVSRETPFGNRACLRALLRSCNEFIYWFDKHFLPAMFDDLWSSADGNVVFEVRILSLHDPDIVTRKTLQLYTAFVRELGAKGIKVEWRVVDSRLVRDTHDRWIISASSAWNVPNANAILSGQNSEILRSESVSQLLQLFTDYWEAATHVLDIRDKSNTRSRLAAV